MGQWTDSRGRVWTARMTVRTLTKFETMTGRKLLEEAFQAWKAAEQGSAFVQFVAGLFKDIYSIAAFLYCLSIDEARDRKVDMDDFSSAIDAGTLPPAVSCATDELVAFFQTATVGMKAVLPLRETDRGGDKTSSSSQP